MVTDNVYADPLMLGARLGCRYCKFFVEGWKELEGNTWKSGKGLETAVFADLIISTCNIPQSCSDHTHIVCPSLQQIVSKI